MGASSMRQPSSPDWMRPITERLSPVIRALVIFNAVTFAFYVLVTPMQAFFKDHLVLGPAALGLAPGQSFEPWQLVTSLFVHIDFISFVFNLIGLWFVGAAIERATGRTRFLLLFFVPALVANAAMALVSGWTGSGEIYAGCSLAILALFVAFGRIFDRTPARVFGTLVLEARTLALILIGFSVLADVARLSASSVAGDVLAVSVAYVVSGGRGEGFSQLWRRLRTKQARRRYQVIEGGRTPKPRYFN
jgi:membrane associated rhomboid family serine protease